MGEEKAMARWRGKGGRMGGRTEEVGGGKSTMTIVRGRGGERENNS